MQAIFKEKIIDVWQISKDKPVEEQWVIEKFDKKEIFWSGDSLRKKIADERLAEKNLEKKDPNPIKADLRWLLFSKSLLSESAALPDEVYLVVQQHGVSSYGRLGDYLLKISEEKLTVMSKEKAKKELQFL